MSSSAPNSLDDLISTLMEGVEIPENAVISEEQFSFANRETGGDFIPNFNVANMMDFLSRIEVEDLYGGNNDDEDDALLVELPTTAGFPVVRTSVVV